MVAEKAVEAKVAAAGLVRRAEIARKIILGPVFPATHMRVLPNGEPERMEEWLEYGAFLADELGEQNCDIRVYQYYLPIYFWVERELNRFRNAELFRGRTEDTIRPMIIGFSCPQGGGKTTMTTFLSKLLAKVGRRTEIASLDDFYVPFKEQCELAERFTGNRLLQYRGMPGTHDLPLLLDTLDAVRTLCEVRECSMDSVKIPRFDKSKHGGRGDRAPEDNWRVIPGTVDVMLLEGWCMGFESLPITEIRDGRLVVVNEVLKQYDEVYGKMDSMLVIEIEDMEWVYNWRMEAERAMRSSGKAGLTDEQVRDFVSRFMPAYQHYSPGLYNRKTSICDGHELHIKIDQNRQPVGNMEG